MLGTQTALFAQCAHMTDDFLGLSKVAESECHHVWGSSCSESQGTFPKSFWIVACIRLAESPLKVVGEGEDKTRMLIG